jgi:hypothetical protein
MESDRIEKLKKELLATERYNNTNIISDTVISLVGIFIPGVETVKNIVNEKVNAFQSKKQLQFCEVVLSEPDLITKEKLQDINFIMEFARTLDVINKVSQNEKVIYIANLFKKSFVKRDHYDLNRFEEYLHRLDFLSLQEIELLVALYQYSKTHNKKYHVEWYDFKKYISHKRNITEDNIISIFSGLCMTGFVRASNVMFPSDDEMENPYYVTDYFEQFLNMIMV